MKPHFNAILDLTPSALTVFVIGGTLLTKVSQALGALPDAAVCVVAYRAFGREDCVDEGELFFALLAVGLMCLPVFLLALRAAVCDAATVAAAEEVLGLDTSLLFAFWISAVL